MSEPKDDLTIFRGMLVLASMSPVFLVWAIIGMEKIPDIYFIPACLLATLIPHLFLLLRIRTAKKNKAYKEFTVQSAKDEKEHLLTYFLPLVLPLMAVSFASWRGFFATLFLFFIMAFASWHLRVFYINIFFAIFGYRIFKITQPTSNPAENKILISKRSQIPKETKISAVKIAGNVYYESNRHIN
ncbi:MAG: hypothetical protein QM496_21010 [Verrucomicrobiota bacterium]